MRSSPPAVSLQPNRRRGFVKMKTVLRISLVLLSTGIIVACGCISPFSDSNRGYIDQLYDRMQGQWMMKNRHQNMPGPMMMYGDTSSRPAVTPAPTTTPGGISSISYRGDIQPIFDRSCIGCHGGQAGLYLESFDYLMSGTHNGPVVIPGNPDASELVLRVTGLRQPAMPLGADPLSQAEIELIVSWVSEGSSNN